MAGCTAVVRTHPPQARIENRTPRPFDDAVWIDGHWQYRHHDWIWESGRWERRPWPDAFWEPGAWAETHRGWKWNPGHWRHEKDRRREHERDRDERDRDERHDRRDGR